MYMFSQLLGFATIPKAYGFEAATHFPSILLGGSLIPIVVYWDEDDFFLAKHILSRCGNDFLNFAFYTLIFDFSLHSSSLSVARYSF